LSETLSPVVPEQARVRPTPVGWIVGICAVVAAAAIFLTPLLWMIFTSFKTYKDITSYPPGLLPTQFTFTNYIQMWGRLNFPKLTLNTVVFAAGVTAFALVFDAMAAYALARLEFPGRGLIFGIILASLMIPPEIRLVPVFNLVTSMGLLNTYAGLILPRAADAFGIFLLRQFFLAIPRDLEDAGRVDGASEFRIFRSLILPLSRPALFTLGLFLFMANWNDLLWPLIMSTNGDLATLPSGLAAFKGQHVTEYGPLMAGSVLAMLPMFVAFFFVQKSFVQSIASTGLK